MKSKYEHEKKNENEEFRRESSIWEVGKSYEQFVCKQPNKGKLVV